MCGRNTDESRKMGKCGIWIIPWVIVGTMFVFFQDWLILIFFGGNSFFDVSTGVWHPSLFVPLIETAVDETEPDVEEESISYLQATTPATVNPLPHSEIPVWPSPKQYTAGTGVTLIHPGLHYQLESSLHNTSSEHDLRLGFKRFKTHAFPHRAVRAGGVTAVSVDISDPAAQLQLGIDESYKLDIRGGNKSVQIAAKTIFGVYHAFETLAQLIEFDFNTGAYMIPNTPWMIEDTPRFRHRGILMDTARHFLPLTFIKRLIDSIKLVKMNTLHWHLVDEQSFPIEIPSRPLLSQLGAYSKFERYSVNDMKEIVEYARLRGVRIVPEVDIPGHAASWCKGYPDVCPSKTCTMPLNIAKDETFKLIHDILTDLSKIFPDEYIHLGGDEVFPKTYKGCWEKSKEISAWLEKKKMSKKDAYLWTIHQVLQIGKSLGKQVIYWDDTFENFGTRLDKSIVIDHWIHKRMSAFTNTNFRVIYSSIGWYLDGTTNDWEKNFNHEPCDDERISPKECDKLVLGGEASLWSENIDPGNLFTTAFPRVGAVAELLWSPKKALDDSVRKRMHRLHCTLFERGFGSSLFAGHARIAPDGPGSCLIQRR